MFHKIFSLLVITFLLSFTSVLQAQRIPIPEIMENSARYRWEHKLVLDSLLLDDAENPANWTHDDFGTMTFTTERAKDGKQSVRLFSKTKGEKATKDNRPWGYCSAIRPVAAENWNKWNRISMWIYPDAPGHKTITAYIQVVNKGKKDRSRDNIVLKNHQWNHIVSEFDWLKRDSITSVEIRCRLSGNEPGTSDSWTYDIDRLELQRVDPDYALGWGVAPGRISFSHPGYSVGSPKSALSNNLTATSFSVVNATTNKPVLSKPIVVQTTYRGKFQVLDFTELNTPGTYYIQAGELKTKTFKIGEQVWLQPIEKALNFYYSLRCGFAVPGFHDVSSQDWRATNGSKSVSLAGGWYDAGDLSQGLYNTAEGTYIMFKLAEQLKQNKTNPALSKQLIDEATWGLDWVLKTTLHDGLRPTWAVLGWWSDGIVGNSDDPHAGFGRGVWQFMNAAAAEAVGYRLLKTIDPVRAAASLKTAEEDWDFAIKELDKYLYKDATCESAALTVIASIELYTSTGKQKYADQALEIAPLLVNSQERKFIPGSNELTGFLYSDTTKTKILHSVFGSGAHELAQIDALSALCEAFPNHAEWMKWYSGVAMYADMYQKISANTAPYNMLPSGIYHKDEYLKTNPKFKDLMKRQLEAGQKVGDDYVVTALPANDGHFGNLHLQLTQTKGVSLGAKLRGDLKLSQLAEQQLEWMLGRNPFSQSFMYGEGYDYIPLYTPMNGNVVGALPVGLPTFGSSDMPYWKPGNNEPSPHEQWIQTVNRFVYLASDLLSPAKLTGKSTSLVSILNEQNGSLKTVRPNAKGEFTTTLPQGNYRVTADGMEHHLTALPTGSYTINPFLDFTVSVTKNELNRVKVELKANGSGNHQFAIRTNNLTISDSVKTIKLKAGTNQQLTWIGTIIDKNSPWFAVVVPDGDITQRKEARNEQKDTLKIGVATTTKALMKLIEPAFETSSKTVEIAPTIAATADVVELVIAGKANVAVTTRNLKDYEKVKCPSLVGTPIGLDGLAIVVPMSNPVTNLTFSQIAAIWTGNIVNWKELGGPDLPIVLIGRTKAYDPIMLFCDFMKLESKPVEGGLIYREKGKEIWCQTVVSAPETDDLALATLLKIPGAITYFPLQVLNNYKGKNVAVKSLLFDGIQPTKETIANGTYFIHRTLNAITNGKPEGNTHVFIDFSLSDEGQKLVENAGFLTIGKRK